MTSTVVWGASLSTTAALDDGDARQTAAERPISAAWTVPAHVVITSAIAAAKKVLIAPLPRFCANSMYLANARKTNRH